MPDENPYHSPLVDSTPNAVAEDVTLRRRPTWRLWVLALIGLPTLIWLCFVLLAVMLEGGSFGALLIPPPIAAAALLIYVGSIVFVLRNWNSSPSVSHLSNGKSFIFGGLIMLTFIAVPSAFFCTCTPIAFAGGSWSYGFAEKSQNMAGTGIFVSIAIGVIVGIICTILTIRLAYNLWRDAVEGLPKSTERETIIRPIPRLQAKKPGADNS